MNIMVSFSGGRTSAVMSKLIKERYGDHNLVFMFANTGEEHEATLDFVDKCDKEFDLNVVWIEAVVHHGERKSCTHRVVDYHTASRVGEPYEEHIKKYGVPGPGAPHQCTRELKLNPAKSFARTLGWEKGYNAVGIRADEMDRMLPPDQQFFLGKTIKAWYPMCEWGLTKNDVNAEVRRWSFDLDIPSDAYGNCVWCWKKSLRKLMTVAKNDPQYFEFPRRMEKYKDVGPYDNERLFFRGHRRADDIIDLAQNLSYEDEYRDETQLDMFSELDLGAACGESCEIMSDMGSGEPDPEGDDGQN